LTAAAAAYLSLLCVCLPSRNVMVAVALVTLAAVRCLLLFLVLLAVVVDVVCAVCCRYLLLRGFA
jgi:hypothetical protein